MTARSGWKSMFVWALLVLTIGVVSPSRSDGCEESHVTGYTKFNSEYYQEYASTGWKYWTANGYDDRITALQSNLQYRQSQIQEMKNWVQRIRQIPAQHNDAMYQDQRMERDKERNVELDQDLDAMPTTLYEIDEQHYQATVNWLRNRHAQEVADVQHWGRRVHDLSDGFTERVTEDYEVLEEANIVGTTVAENAEDRVAKAELRSLELQIQKKDSLDAFRKCRDKGGAWGYFSGNWFQVALPNDKACETQTCLCMTL